MDDEIERRKRIENMAYQKRKDDRPLVKININVSKFFTRYRTIVFFKEEKKLLRLLI